MATNKFSYLNFKGNDHDNRPRYREDDYQNRNTYNFVTDPRLKRGGNYGIVYVTSTAFENNEMPKKTIKISQKEAKKRQEEARQKKAAGDLQKMSIPFPEGLVHVEVMTDDYTEEILPKPVTKELEFQTRDYIDRPMTPLFTPVKDGEDKGTQLNEGELFDFDEEVEPIINVLTFKTLEQARMEVLEEDELQIMKEQQEVFEKVRNRELEVVQKLENEERRRNEEKTRRNLEREMRIDMGKIYQQKLISCVFGKKYLLKLKETSLNALETVGVLKNPVLNQYHTTLLPYIKEGTDTIYDDEKIILDSIDNIFDELYINQQKKNHKQAIINERKRIDEIEHQRQEELRRKEEEKIRRREERKRKQHEKELEDLKKTIIDELIVNGQFIDEPVDIYNIDGYNKKGTRNVQLTAGHLGQIVIELLLVKDYLPAELPFDDELIEKIVDLYLIKCPIISLLYRNEELEKYKERDPNIASMEDIFKCEDAIYNEMCLEIIESAIKYDELLPMVFESMSEALQIEGAVDLLIKIINLIMKIAKNSTDFVNKDKIKFVPVEEGVDPNITAICYLKPPIFTKMRPPIDITQQLLAKKAAKKGDKPPRPNFEPFFSSKTFTLALASDKMRIVAFNSLFDKIFRNNFIECITKIEKVEFDKDVVLPEIEMKYSTILEKLNLKLIEKYNKEILEIIIEDPALAAENFAQQQDVPK